MPSREALAFWDAMRAAPKQVDLALPARRAAGERAEAATAELMGVTYRPAPEVSGLWAIPEAARPGAAMLYLFGGGYVLGSAPSRRKTAGHLAKAARATVLVPGYRLAPEHPFPAAIEDAVAAYRFLLDGGRRSDAIAIAGDSSGGGLAVACGLAVRDRGLAAPAGVAAISPWADLDLLAARAWPGTPAGTSNARVRACSRWPDSTSRATSRAIRWRRRCSATSPARSRCSAWSAARRCCSTTACGLSAPPA